MDPELASFVTKFQDICNNGKNAILSFSSLNGKVLANLSVEIGAVKPPSKVSTPCATSPPTNASHVSPSRKRRTLRRAEARALFAEEAKLDLSVEELSVLNAAEKAVDDSVQNMESDEHDSLEVKDDSNDTQNEISIQDTKILISEDCANNVEAEAHDSTNQENADCDTVEEMDKHEQELDKFVTEILIYAVPPSDIRKPMQDANEVKTEIMERFSSIGVEVQNLKVEADRLGKFERSLARITPVNLRRIWGRRLGLQNCAVIDHKK